MRADRCETRRTRIGSLQLRAAQRGAFIDTRACRLHKRSAVALGGEPGGAMRRTAVCAAAAYLATVGLLLISRPASSQNAPDGKSIFRFDTFGDEQLWTNTLHLEQPLAT